MLMLEGLIDTLRTGRIEAYKHAPGDIKEHYGIEQTVLAGGYGYRQVLELVQNGADAILEANESGDVGSESRIEVLLDGKYLYVANTGAPLTEEGVDALLRSHSSPKRGNQIGRFGLGFKSLLRLRGKIDLFSKTVVMRFDPDRCRRELRDQFGVEEAPGLRLAWSLNEAEERLHDQRLEDLSWATTIVRAEIAGDLDSDIVEHLRGEIQSFPSEFLLFLPVSVALRLVDGAGGNRDLRREPGNECYEVLLHDSARSTPSRWRVVTDEVHITAQKALDDATHIHARSEVPLSWAIPLDVKREEAGRFWAFFPTHTATYVPGILNAPWKLNSDRNAVIAGEWNSALMVEAARIIAAELPKLSIADDPARPLDAFPRQLERKDEDAAPLVEAVWEALENVEVIPDAAGKLRSARDLWRHPRANSELAQEWLQFASPESQSQLVHSSCLLANRASRLGALAQRLESDASESPIPALRRMEASDWFAAIATCEPSSAIGVLKLAEACSEDCKPNEWSAIRSTLKVIPTREELVKPSDAVIAPQNMTIPGRSVVAAFVADDVDAKRILVNVMKIAPLDDDVWATLLGEAIDAIPDSPASAIDAGWTAFWATLRSAPERARQLCAMRNKNRIKVRRRNGSWGVARVVFLPGRLVSADDPLPFNTRLLIDDDFHSEDMELLTALGISDFPEGKIDLDRKAGVSLVPDWMTHWCDHYKAEAKNSARTNYLQPFGLKMPIACALLPKLSGAANAKLTLHLLEYVQHGEFAGFLEFGHRTMPSYQRISVPHPLSWFLIRHGSTLIGSSAIPLSAVVARRHEPALSLIPGWADLESEIDRLGASLPPVDASEEAVTALWSALMDAAVTPEALRSDSLHDLWSGAARDGVIPDRLPNGADGKAFEDVFATTSPDLAKRVRNEDRIVVTLDDETMAQWLDRGARDLDELLKTTWDEVLGPSDFLTSVIPDLADVLTPESCEEAQCQVVSGLSLVVDDTSEPIPCLLQDNILLLDRRQLDSLPRSKRLEIILREVAAAGWLRLNADESLRILGDGKVEELRARVAAENTLPERLLAAVGMRSEPLRAVLGDLGSKEFVQDCTDLQLAELVLSQLGPSALSALSETLEAEGLNPPGKWNSAEARVFVNSIGFPLEYATSPTTKRGAEEIISGPIFLPPLHNFQKEVFEGLRDLVVGSTGRRRAVVSLPTGGGKTRVTVQAAVELVLKPTGPSRSVIWVAQTDELCEQAVQAFRQVWVNLGTRDTDLRIIRLWGGNPSPAVQDSQKPIVVVASIQTLNSRVGRDGLEALKRPGLVVVDECHHAITKSYTNMLRWLGAEAQRPSSSENEEPPIIGLSATPFRTDDEESSRLAKRFGNTWFPADQAGLHRLLKEDGVLASVHHEPLQSPAVLPQAEIENLQKLGGSWEGVAFDNILERINQFLAKDDDRNQALVTCIEQSSEKSILFYANSVDHAAEMAARLQLAGIPAAAVSGSSSPLARRFFLDGFQRGDIRVLCNHSVLTTGFDAPKTDMVLIARQVFSPVRYMQMVGRGMRGEKNGGTARCRLVTVMDNLGRFQDKHPYHFCAKYFSENNTVGTE